MATPLMRLRTSFVARCAAAFAVCRAGFAVAVPARTACCADTIDVDNTTPASATFSRTCIGAILPFSTVPFHATAWRNRNAIICQPMGNQRIRVFAPATVANIGPGFDVLGLALSSPGDVLEAELSDEPGVVMVEITGDGGRLSRDAMKNVASRAASDVLRRA